MNRRSFIKGLGTVSVLVTGGVVYRAYDGGAFTIGQGPNFDPWITWRTESVPAPMRLVRAGILAASPHNTQPWLFRVNSSSIGLFADPSRHLGAMDPYFREMSLGLGCAIENMVVAGRVEGYDCQVTLATGSLSNQLVERVDREQQLAQPPVSATKLAQLTGERDWYPTFAFRMGYPLQVARPVPRRPVSEVLLKPSA